MSAAVAVRRPPLPIMPKIGKGRTVVVGAQLKGIVDGDQNTITLKCLGKKTWLASRALGVGMLAFHSNGVGPVDAISKLHALIEKDRASCEAEEDLAPALEASLAAMGGAS